MSVILELGKSYVTAIHEEENLADDAIVKIVGIVDSGTIEYEKGFRFFTDSGLLYKPDGTSPDVIITTSEDGSIKISQDDGNNQLRIVREAVSTDFEDGYEEYSRIDIEEYSTSDKFISCNHPDFKMSLGNIYVDRFGIYRYIDKIYRFNDTKIWGPDGGMRFMSGKYGYESDGRESRGRSSMYDIVYMKL